MPKTMTLLTRSQASTINMVSDISKQKSNEAMKFGQLIKYCGRNIFLDKSCRIRSKEISFTLVVLNFNKTSNMYEIADP